MRRIMVLGVLVLMLAGCAVPNAFPAFDREQAEHDLLPGDFDVIDLDGYDPDSSRRSGEYDGVTYYLLRQQEGSGVCVGIANGAESMIACGGPAGELTASGQGIRTVRLVVAPARAEDGWIVVSENLLVAEDVR